LRDLVYDDAANDRKFVFMRNSARIFQRTLNAAVLLLPAALSCACGGSSSETPPPLEPDPHAFRSRPAAASPASRPTYQLGDDAEELTTPRAPSTWGGASRRRVVDAGY
jgi:hypothetical protein